MACARIVAAPVGGSVVACSASGAPINVVLADDPEIASSNVGVDYNPHASLLKYVATGTLRFSTNLEEFAIANGTFTAFITMDTNGDALEGSFRVRGGIADGNPITGGSGEVVTLLEGEVIGFGWEQGSRRLETMFNVQGGALQGLFGSEAGLVVDDSGFGGSWSFPFGSTRAFATLGSVLPTPGALACAAGALALGARRRRR